ncbi:MAG: kelch repeat-containing protein, partial [Bacteroidota bacterium]
MRQLFTLALFVGITTLAFGQAWNQQTTSGDPEARSHATAVYDSLNHRMIVFGGRAVTGFLNDLWSLDLNTNTWTEITVSGGAIPSPRWTHNATWDAPNQQLYIWTGQGQGNALFNDVWVFRFADNTWNELSPDGNATGIPTRRYGSGTVLNEANGLLVTFA